MSQLHHYIFVFMLDYFPYFPYSHVFSFWMSRIQPCKSHDHDHQGADLVMTWLAQEKKKRQQKVVRLVWEFDWLHFAQYITIRSHDIDCKPIWCEKIKCTNRASWLNHLELYILCHVSRSVDSTNLCITYISRIIFPDSSGLQPNDMKWASCSPPSIISTWPSNHQYRINSSNVSTGV